MLKMKIDEFQVQVYITFTTNLELSWESNKLTYFVILQSQCDLKTILREWDSLDNLAKIM